MQKQWWTQPALQTSEAVLLPALEGREDAAFRHVTDEWDAPQGLALSTYVRPRGSMAGRSVLRAVGVRSAPYLRGASPSTRPLLRAARGRLR